MLFITTTFFLWRRFIKNTAIIKIKSNNNADKRYLVKGDFSGWATGSLPIGGGGGESILSPLIVGC